MAEVADRATLQQHAERLYAGTPDDFVATRDELVRSLRSAGDRDTASAVKALRRPTQAAWAANVLVRERPGLVEELLELGAALRTAQATLDAETLRELTRQRRRVVAQVAREAGDLARGAGSPLTAATERQVEDTLQAAVVDADLAEVLRSGLLVQPLSSTGVESLADVQAIPGAPRLTVVPDAPAAPADEPGPDEAEERAAREREQERSRERTRLQRDRRSQRRDLEKAEAAASRLRRDVEDLQQRLEAARATLGEAEQRRDAVSDRIAALDRALAELTPDGSGG